MKQYKTLHVVGDLQPNCLIPADTFTDEELATLERDGHIEAVNPYSPEDATPKGDPAVPVGPRNLDPSLLQGKSLEELNAMVIERQGTEEYETEAEAIAFLSEHFKAGTKVSSPR